MKRRILTNFVQVLTAAVVLTAIAMAALTYSMMRSRVIEELRVDAQVIAASAEAAGFEPVIGALDGALRVTLVEADGAVCLDSEADAAAMENHLARPEIRDALAQGEGSDVRESHTLQRSTFYYAARLPDGRVLRVAKESMSLVSVYLRALPLIALVMLAMIAVCAGAANALTERLLEPIGRLATDGEDAALYPELTPLMHTIRSQHEEILKSANMRVEFTANVSHELKTPLTAISGYAELIESGMAGSEQARRFAGEIHKSASRLLTLINDTIRLSQMDAPEFEPTCEAVDLMQTAQTVIEQLRVSAGRMRVDLQADLRPAMVYADRGMMEELIYNLCDNAIRYNVSGGSVRVEVHPVRDKVVLTVQDTGIGISRENQEHVFERFYRVDKSRSKATGGTGLGLAIVKHIAVKHGAQIAMDSELGRGTCISVTFDRCAGA